MPRGGLDVAVGPRGLGFCRVVIYPEGGLGTPGVVVGVWAPGPCVVEQVLIDADELDLTGRYFPMAFPWPLPSQATAALDPILLAGKHLLRSGDSDGRGIRTGFVGFGDPRRFVFWPRVVIEWPRWWPGLVIRETVPLFVTRTELALSCRLLPVR